MSHDAVARPASGLDRRVRGITFSHACVQMAHGLGVNPTKLGALDNTARTPERRLLPEFIERVYGKRFGQHGPEVVVSIEERA